MKPLVSTVIVSYNKPEYIEQAIKSAELNSKGLETEIIVVDDASGKETYNKLLELNKIYDFTLAVNSENRGPSACRNKGIEISRGKYIAFLDGDDYWLDGRLEETLKPLEQNPKLDFVFCDAYMEIDDVLTTKKQSELMPPPAKQKLLDHLFRRNCVNMCSTIIKKALAEQIKFDESLRSAEDYDFWLRTTAASNNYQYIDKPLVVYRLHKNNLSSKRQLSIDSTLSVLSKNTGLAQTKLAKKNLRSHRESLLQDRLKIKMANPRETLAMLKEIRNLGKRERLVYMASSIHKSVGEFTRGRLIK